VPVSWLDDSAEVPARAERADAPRRGTAETEVAARKPEREAAEAPPDRVAPPAPRPRPAASEPTAAALFSAANAARRGGDFDRAKRTYSELIARYPTSDEARLARVSLGKLLLAKGNASGAEKEFDQYLKGGSGQLAEEALVSRAQSLRKLGRTDAERATWQRLLAEHPNSVYAAEARGRLQALGRGAPPR
jgi:TolA-binding protein